MTDIISSNNNVKMQQKSTRRVSLLQNKTTLSSALTTEMPSTLLLIKNGLTSNNLIPCVTSSPRPSLWKPTQVTSLKSSLKQNNNLPALNKKKSVRFNFPLTQIMHFYTPPTLDEEEVFDEKEEGNKIIHYEDNEQDENYLEDAFLKLFNSLFSSSDYDSNLYHPVIQQHIFDASSNKLSMVLSNWPSTHPTRRFITQMVSLENLSWENASSTIRGRVLVHNLAYEKRVTIRMSFNHWHTYVDIDATYTESSKGDALDRFTFEMITPNHLSYINRICNTSSCSLAVRYQVNGREFWDNNGGDNFNIRWDTKAGDSNNFPVLSNTYLACNRDQRNSLQQQKTTTNKQESDVRQIKKKNHCISLSGPTNYHFINQSAPLLMNEKHQHQTSLLTSSTQQQISAHFQLYLERKRRSEERQRATSDGQTLSPTLLASATKNEQVLLST